MTSKRAWAGCRNTGPAPRVLESHSVPVCHGRETASRTSIDLIAGRHELFSTPRLTFDPNPRRMREPPHNQSS